MGKRGRKLTNQFGMMDYIRGLSKTGKRIKAVKSQMFAGQVPERYVGTRCRRKELLSSPQGGAQDAAFPLAFGVGRQAAPGAWMGTTAHWQQFWGSAFNWDEKKAKSIKMRI